MPDPKNDAYEIARLYGRPAEMVDLAAHIEIALAAERERCARIAEDHGKTLTNGGAINACRYIAKTTRRGS